MWLNNNCPWDNFWLWYIKKVTQSELIPDPIANALVGRVSRNVYASWIGSGIRKIQPEVEKKNSTCG